MTIGSSGVVTVNGASDNSGDLLLSGGAARLRGSGALSNNSLLRGDGTVAMALTNAAGGEIRATEGNLLRFESANSANAGHVNLQGGTVEFLQPLVNAASGQITGRGTLDVGGAGLTNNGHVALSSGITQIFGDVTNDTGSASMGITVSGNADATFWGDVQNTSGRFQVSSGSSATFFGTFGGNGITGTGDVYMEADVTPGSSPGVQDFGGNLQFGPVARLVAEIGGLLPGTQHDQVNAAGQATLAGTLDVSLIDDFTPSAGDTFEVLTAASIVGEFDTVDLSSLPGNLLWFVNYDSTSVELVATFSADFDEDGLVGGNDLNSWEANFGQNGSPLAAAVETVPEPNTLVLAALCLVFRRRC